MKKNMTKFHTNKGAVIWYFPPAFWLLLARIFYINQQEQFISGLDALANKA